MEKRQLRPSVTSKTGEWIKCQSKQRPGKFYMFNKQTGETRWCSEFEDSQPRTTRSSDFQKSPTMPQGIAKRKEHTPAQDRLKRLQNNLTKEQKEKITLKRITTRRRKSQDQLPANISQENVNAKRKEDIPNKTKTIFKLSNTSLGINKLSNTSSEINKLSTESSETKKDCQPSTSKSALLLNIERNKRAVNSSPQKTQSTTKLNQKTISKEAKKRSATYLSTTDSPTKHQKRSQPELPLKEKDQPNSDMDAKIGTNTEEPKSEAGGFGSSFVNKIKAFCQGKFSSYYNVKKVLSQKPLEPCIKKTNYKIPIKVPDARPTTGNSTLQNRESEKSKSRSENDATNNNNCMTTVPMAILMKGTATPKSGEGGSVDFKAIAVSASPSQLFKTPNNTIMPAYQRGSANSRLERLRNSLNQQNFTNDSQISTPRRLCASACSSALACVIRDAPISSSYQPSDEDEPMDWLPIEDLKTEAIEISSNDGSSNSARSIRGGEAENMGEYYGTVNENLLRYAAEQKHGGITMTERWLSDCYYFVLDTNVLIEHLVFLEELSHMKLCDTSGTILYVPYCVLQELDKLKQFAVGDGAKVRAVRAIKYLNANFEAKNKHLQAQSALSELEHLVEITSPDDRIINTCLQVKQHVEHVILLTEDINLRNKAICNNILVATKSDLIAKHT